MRASVITILDLPQSLEAAARCIESGRAFGVEVEIAPAVTPADDPLRLMVRRCMDPIGFRGNRYSREEPSAACFLSHAGLWARCAGGNESHLILEHDAVFEAPLPDLSGVMGACNLGRPSYGVFNTPALGLGPLVSKPQFPGTHAYVVTPAGAEQLLGAAKTEACTPDVFLSLKRFPWLQEAYPWPVVACDWFTTIQAAEGIKAKHNRVEILEW